MDIEIEPVNFRLVRAISLICVALALVVVGSCVVTIAMRAPIWVFTAISGTPVAIFVMVSVIRSRFTAIRAVHTAMNLFDQDSSRAVEALAREKGNWRGELWPRFARTAFDRGLRDVTIGVRPTARPPAPPLDKPISPLPLDEADENFRALARDWLDAKSDSASYLTRRWRRAIYMMGNPYAWAYTCLVLTWQAWLSIKRGKATHEIYLLLASLLVPLAGLMFGFLLASRQLFVTNGGLVRRVARRGGGWHVEVFRREDSVLIVYPVNPKIWRMLLRNKSGLLKVLLTPIECAMLLAAWRSPLPPPTAEALADLAE